MFNKYYTYLFMKCGQPVSQNCLHSLKGVIKEDIQTVEPAVVSFCSVGDPLVYVYGMISPSPPTSAPISVVGPWPLQPPV